MVDNPFTPAFGEHPRVVVGRDDLIARMARAFDGGWRLERTTLLEAPRGTGKTVLLDAIQDEATARGWLVIEEDAGETEPRLSDRIAHTIAAFRAELDGPGRSNRTTSGEVSLGVARAGISWERPGEPGRNVGHLRNEVVALLAHPAAPAGVLISLDEIHEITRADIHSVANTYQHWVRAKLAVAFVAAGLPPIDRNQRPTFLARCHRPDIASVDDTEIARGYTVTADPIDWEPAALTHAVRLAAGLPYMMQLVGYHAFDTATARNTTTITISDVAAALPHAERQLTESVLNTTDRRLTRVEHAFLRAMSVDSGPTRVADLATRLGVSRQYINDYRDRLTATGIIHTPGRGYVDFVLPTHPRCPPHRPREDVNSHEPWHRRERLPHRASMSRSRRSARRFFVGSLDPAKQLPAAVLDA
jgi:hypothetical protein